MVNTLIPPTGGSDVVRGIQKKLRIMKKEYLIPQIQLVTLATTNILANSIGFTGGEGDTDDFGVKEENGSTNTTNGGTIWDNEW